MSETNKNVPAQQNNESKKPSTLVDKISGAGKTAVTVGTGLGGILGGLAALLSAFDKDEK